MDQITKPIPVVREKLPWQSANSMLNDPLKFLWGQSHTNEIFRVDAPVPLFVLSNPSHIRNVLLGKSENYEKGSSYRGFATLVGNGILTSEESHWRRQRRAIQPSFNKCPGSDLPGILAECAAKKTEYLQTLSGESVDLKSMMTDYAQNVIGKFLMGRELVDLYQPRLLPLVMEQYDFVMMQNRTFFKFPLWVPTPRQRRFMKTKKELREVVEAIIREKTLKPDETVLSKMIQAEDPDHGKMTISEIHDEFLTLFVTGYETTANALSWIFILLARHPLIQEKLYREIKDLDNEGGGPSLGSLKENAWLQAVINESLRIYPPVWGYPRRCKEGDKIDGFTIPPKAHIHLSIFMAHRNPKYWDQPNMFKPERFLEKQDHPAFMPFGLGARMCIGKHLALQQMNSLVYNVISKFRVEPVSFDLIEMQPMVTLHPKGEVLLKFISRHS